MNKKESKKENIFGVLRDDIFTDREEVLNYFWELIEVYIPRYVMANTVLIAHRRQGKTELFHRLYNKAFWEQDKVVPIYYTFEEANFETLNFAENYIKNFMQQCIGFKEKDTGYLKKIVNYEEVLRYSEEKNNYGLNTLVKKFMGEKSEYWFLKSAIQGPRQVAEDNEERILVMLDEFHNVKRIRNKDGTGVESWICPHFITGSAVTMMLKEIVGSGSLYNGGIKTYRWRTFGKEISKRVWSKYWGRNWYDLK
ncbi:MAG: hypothetical protein ACE5J9_05295 [Methanosarcinales archaeon]